MIKLDPFTWYGEADTPTLALCFAIENLIDSGEAYESIWVTYH